SLRTFVVRA
ncbi:Hypothetical protein, putative, partial [Bodo saltans]